MSRFSIVCLAAVSAVALAPGAGARAQRAEIWRSRVSARVLQQVSQQGATRVIVRLRSQGVANRVIGDAVRALRGLKRFDTVPVLAAEVDAADLQRLASHPDVEAIVEDAVHPLALAESTTLVGVPAAVARGFTGSGWTIAVLDTGIDKTHPFLSGKVVSEACYSSNSSGYTTLCPGGVTESTAAGSGVNCASGCEHGTHVAGIAAGKGGAFSGVARDASLISINVFSRRSADGALGAFDSDLLKALERVFALRTTYNIAAANMSLGGGLFSSYCDGDILKPTIDQLRAAGIATVVASGNNSSATSISSPACVSTAVSVGSVGDGSGGSTARAVSSFSNSASILNLLAPGSVIASSIPGGAYANASGTSMATPHVAGAWAIVKQRRPGATVPEVLSLLTRTGRGVFDSRNGITKPLIDLDAATADACTVSLGASAASVSAGGGSGAVGVFTAADCGWTAAADAGFVTITSGASGAGNGSVSYRVAANPDASFRTGHIIVSGRTFTITQQPAPAGGTSIDDTPGMPVLVWHNTRTGALEAWRMSGRALSTITPLPSMTSAGWNLAGAVDFTSDGQRDLLWHNIDDGSLVAWVMNGDRFVEARSVSPSRQPDANWQIAGVGDMNGDGRPDLLWQHETDGRLKVWFMNGLSRTSESPLDPPRVANTNWKVVGLVDVNADGAVDLIWQHLTEGWIFVSFMDGLTQTSSEYLVPSRASNFDWRVVATVDSDGDGRRDDLIWQHKDNGLLYLWRMEGRVLIDQSPLDPDGRSAGWRLPGARYLPVQTQPDFNGNGRGDFLMRNRTTGRIDAWLMNGSARLDVVEVGSAVPDTYWQIVAVADFNADGSPDILWQHIDGWLNVWLMRSGRYLDTVELDPDQEPDSGWRVATAYDVNGDRRPDLLWQNRLTGQMRIWYMEGLTRSSVGSLARDRSNDPNWRVVGTGDVNQDGNLDLVWWHPIDGWLTAWYMNGTSVIEQIFFNPERVADTNWQPVGVTDMNADGLPDIVWQYRTSGYIQVWFMFGGRLIDSAWTSPLAPDTANTFIAGVK